MQNSHPGGRITNRLARVYCFLLFSVVSAAAQFLNVPVHGHAGGVLHAAINSEPRTLNPLEAVDASSRLIVGLCHADLMHINPVTLAVEPALATSVHHSRDGLHWTVHLRRGVQFSDGTPFTSADVVFSFQAYEDPRTGAPQRDLLVMNGKPIVARAAGPYTVTLELPRPYAAGDRLFDGFWMLPRHLLASSLQAGTLGQSWGIGTAPNEIAGLGPFELASYRAGEEVALRPNPHYWMQDRGHHRLPYLAEIDLLEVTDPNTRSLWFERGRLDLLDPVAPGEFSRLQASPKLRLLDAGPGLEPTAIVFNLNEGITSPDLLSRQAWFLQTAFRRAVSETVDRQNLVTNVFGGRAAPLSVLTTPGEGRWAAASAPSSPNLAAAMDDLAQSGMHRSGDRLLDSSGRPVSFSVIVPASNEPRLRMARFIADDLRQVGMQVTVVPLDFPSFADRLLHRKDYDAALMAFGLPDADPNVESSIWSLDGGLHLWRLQPTHPAPWELELDRLYHAQMVELKAGRRLQLYQQMQQIERAELPMIPLVAPDILTGASSRLQNASAGRLAPHLLWAAPLLSWPAQ